MGWLRGGWGAACGVSLLGALSGFACTDTGGLEGEPLGHGTKDAGEAGSGGDGGSSSKDSGTVTDDDSGTTPATGACDTTKDYGSPVIVAELDSAASSAKSAVLTPDGLDAYFISYDGSAFTLRHARRKDKGSAFGAPVTVPMTPPPMATLSLTAAGQRLYFWNDTTTVGDYVTTRTSTTAEFTTASQINATTEAFRFFATSNNDTAYYGNTADGGLEKSIKSAPLSSSGFTAFASAEVKNTHAPGANDDYPVLNASETILYFSSNNRTLSLGGALDIWVSRRPSKGADFGPASLVTALSSATSAENVSWVSDDDCEIFIDRASHIYRATRPR